MSEETNSTSQAREDIFWIKTFQSGDIGAFDPLVLKYKDRIFNLCYRFLGHYEDANDTAQETFVKVYRSLNQFRQQSAFYTWLYRIALNTCKTKLTSAEYKQRRKTLSLNVPGKDGSSPAIDPMDKVFSARERLEQQETDQEVRWAIDQLDADHRTVILLREIENLTYEQISEITSWNVGTVKSKLARAREKLRQVLERKR